MYAFSSILLAWLPPLMFGVLYEATGSMRAGMGVACVWHGAACVVLLAFVDVAKGSENAAATLNERRGAGGAAGDASGGARVAPAEDAPVAPS